MVRYCVEEWPLEVIQEGPIYWPWYGTKERWLCIALNKHVNTKDKQDDEGKRCAACWLEAEVQGERTKVFKFNKVGEEEEKVKSKEKWDLLDHLPPPPPPVAPPPVAPAPQIEAPAPQGDGPQSPIRRELTAPNSSNETIGTIGTNERVDEGKILEKAEGPYANTRAKVAKRVPYACDEKDKKAEKLLPLREVPMGGVRGDIGFVNTPLPASEVRAFKKEIKSLLEDPLGVANQLDQFLGPSIYTWDKLNLITGILFFPEEMQLIRMAGMRIWERENRPGSLGEEKMPLNSPEWDLNDDPGRRNVNDYRALIIKEMREAVPRTSNAKLAFDSQQERDENQVPGWQG